MKNYIKIVKDIVGDFYAYSKGIQERIEYYNYETIWCNIFHDTITGYDWYDLKNLSLGKMAIGYNFAYVLVRVLEEFQPSSVLELGMGQSSRIVNSYFKNRFNEKEKYTYDLVEQDQDWIGFFMEKNNLTCPNVYQCDVECDYKDSNLFKYKDFSRVFEDEKKIYQLILIDGPKGSDTTLSRVDVLENIPQILAESFVMIFDDTQRRGECNMIEEVKNKLEKNNISYAIGKYKGISEVSVVVSKNNRFLASL